jgi:hypothetical protein
MRRITDLALANVLYLDQFDTPTASAPLFQYVAMTLLPHFFLWEATGKRAGAPSLRWPSDTGLPWLHRPDY